MVGPRVRRSCIMLCLLGIGMATEPLLKCLQFRQQATVARKSWI